VAAPVPGVVAPGVIGGAGLNVRYLERSGLSRAAVTLANTAAFAVHVAFGAPLSLLREAPAYLAGAAGARSARRPAGWASWTSRSLACSCGSA
jgi:hypothetical protein